MSLQNDIDGYIGHFKGLVSSVQSLSADSQVSLFRQTLLVSILDTLSKCRYPTETRNSVRFKTFIRNFSNWPDYNKVSLTQLQLYLNRLSNNPYPLTLDYVNALISTWKKGDAISIANDPDYALIENIEQMRELNKFTHINLLWSYRNILVHEARKPGYGMALSSDDEPFYHSMDYMNGNFQVVRWGWELVYPENFYSKITQNCIDNLEKYLVANNQNPYDSYKFGSSWI